VASEACKAPVSAGPQDFGTCVGRIKFLVSIKKRGILVEIKAQESFTAGFCKNYGCGNFSVDR